MSAKLKKKKKKHTHTHSALDSVGTQLSKRIKSKGRVWHIRITDNFNKFGAVTAVRRTERDVQQMRMKATSAFGTVACTVMEYGGVMQAKRGGGGESHCGWVRH